MTTRTRRATGLIKLSADAAKPLSHQLADTLRRLIVEGIWIRDDKLPGSRTIADDARVSRNTVNAALEMLISEGMLEARGRSGLYVTWKHAPRTQRMEISAKDEAVRRRPFALDALPLELFPLDTWKRLQARHWSKASSASLENIAPAGAQPLREAIAQLVNVAAGISCRADQVFVVNGIRDALTLVKHALRPDVASVWTEDPNHPLTRGALRAAGLDAISVPVDSQGINVDAALQIDARARLALVRPAFQYPTGAMLSPARERDLIAWSKQTGALILEDATESEFSFSKRTFRSLATLEPGSVVHFNTFTRTLFPSLGIGYLIAPDRLVDAFAEGRRKDDAQMPLATQDVLADFIDAGHFSKHVRNCRDLAGDRHSTLLNSLAQLAPRLVLDRQFGGLHVCARLPGHDQDTQIVAHAAAVGLDIAPLSATYSKKALAQGLLLGYAGFDSEATTQAVRALADILSRTHRH